MSKQIETKLIVLVSLWMDVVESEKSASFVFSFLGLASFKKKDFTHCTNFKFPFKGFTSFDIYILVTVLSF